MSCGTRSGRIAELTRNEAAFVSGGAAAGMFLSAAVCMARDTDDGVFRTGALDGLPREFLILARLRAGPPRIELLPEGDDRFYLAPETLLPGEEAVVTQRLAEVLESRD